MKSRRVYIDSSVFGGCFEDKFASASRALFSEIHEGKTIAVISELVITELMPAPDHVRDVYDQLPEAHVEMFHVTQEVEDLAKAYLQAGVVPKGSVVDANHVAAATLTKVDVIVSWNFKHLVNLRRIHKFNGVNLMKGYGIVEIRSPWEVLLEEPST